MITPRSFLRFASLGAFALLTVACATAAPQDNGWSTIDQINTGAASSAIRVSDNSATPTPDSSAMAVDTIEAPRVTMSEQRTAGRMNQSLFGGSGSGVRTGIGVFVSQTRFSRTSNSTLAGSTATGGIGVDVRNATGYGATLGLGLGSALGLEVGVSWIKPDVVFTPAFGNFGTVTTNSVRMVPITAALQWHFIPNGTVDPYIGAGATYVSIHNSGNFNTSNGAGLQQVNFNNEVGPMINAGVNLGFAHSIGLLIDGKYTWLHQKGTTTFTGGLPGSVGGGGSFNLNPLIISAGLRLGF